VKRAGALVAPALCVLGSTAVFAAVLRGSAGALLGAAGGFAAASGLSLLVISWWTRAHPASTRPLDYTHVLDLVRRTYDGAASWGIGLRGGNLETLSGDAPDDTVRRRGKSIVELASVDGREHIVRDQEGVGVFAAIGDFPYGVGLLLPATVSHDRITACVDDLRHVIAGMRAAEARAPEGQGQIVAQQLALGAAGAQTLEGLARAGAELAQQSAQRPAIVVIKEDDAGVAIATSSAADRRLGGLRLAPDAPVARAMETALPIVTRAREDILGPLPGLPDRRRHDKSGAAYPLMDGRVVIGALVLLGGQTSIDAEGPVAERIRRLVAELGPRLAAAKAVHDARRRAVLDPLTSLANRGEFERVLEVYRRDARNDRAPPATLVYVDLDFFKRLNDTLGHAAGDAALRHVARVLETAVRDRDLVARIGGEEFAIWLPETPPAQGWEVAERIRTSVARTAWQWTGERQPLTTSCGVASYPEPIRDLLNLPAAADAALYRAKQGGRNRVERA